MMEYGWRIPFLVAAPLGIIALYIRRRVEDTPEFKAMSHRGEISQAPVREAVRMRRNFLLIFGIGAFHATAFYVVFTYMPTYINTVAKHGATLSLVSTLLTGVVVVVLLPTTASLSDRIGRRPVLLAGGLGFLVVVWPVFQLILVAGPVVAVICQLVLGAFMAVSLSASAAVMPELFPARVRTSGMSIGYSIPAALFGGGAPFIATFLIQQTNVPTSPAFFLIGTAIIGLTAALFMRAADLHDDKELLEGSSPSQKNSHQAGSSLPTA
jgi:MHS family proline/betaine transporter-like MFS transporter